MHDSERNRLRKEQLALLLGASDMRQAAAAARALAGETKHSDLARALETAMVVCFMRPSTKGGLGLPDKLFPTGRDRDAVDTIKARRDQEFAHTDAASGRSFETVSVTFDGDGVGVEYEEGWHPLPRELLEPFIALSARLATDMQHNASAIQLLLDGYSSADL